jgi:[ribosomal protein S18]-alanine N-acetyltransferase
VTPADMAALHARCFTSPRPWGVAEFAAIVSDPLCFTLIESDGFLVGRAVADEAEILTLAVDPEARRRGIGAKLVQGFLAEAHSRGAVTVFLEVAADNQPAISLYLQARFAKVGVRRGYYTQPDSAAVDAVVMQRAV